MNSSQLNFQWAEGINNAEISWKSKNSMPASHFWQQASTLPQPRLYHAVYTCLHLAPLGPSRCCCSLLSQTRALFPPTAEIRDNRGSIRACLTWHFLVNGWTDYFTPLCPYCYMSALKFTAFVLLVPHAEDLDIFFFPGTMFSLLHCI